MQILNEGFDHVEFVVHDLTKYGSLFTRMGFEKVGSRHLTTRGLRSDLYAQGMIRVMLTQSDQSSASERELAIQFLNQQGEGICVLAIEVDDATRAFDECTRKGARPAMQPKMFESPEGRVVRSEIYTPGLVRYAFIERVAPNGMRGPALFDDGLIADRLESPMPLNLWRIDHLTNNVSMGEMAKWVEWYKNIFGFTVTRHFDIRTGRTGLISDVVQSVDGKIIVPINEATEAASQVQEFVNRLKGPGVQHLALETKNIVSSLKKMRSDGFKFLTVPHTYYEEVPTRVPGVTENLGELEELGILLDGEDTGYLLQIFSEELMGPFFCEYIQRKGNKGFGEGNFRALFEAIERDQIKRGVLKA